MSGLAPKSVKFKLSPNAKNFELLKIKKSQNVLKSDLEKSRICPILGPSGTVWEQIWHRDSRDEKLINKKLLTDTDEPYSSTRSRLVWLTKLARREKTDVEELDIIWTFNAKIPYKYLTIFFWKCLLMFWTKGNNDCNFITASDGINCGKINKKEMFLQKYKSCDPCW